MVQFEVGEHVTVDNWLFVDDTVVIIFLGNTYTMVEDSRGNEHPVKTSDLRKYERPLNISEIVELGNDLINSIQNAAWNDDVGSNNLSGPTNHMREAVSNWIYGIQRGVK